MRRYFMNASSNKYDVVRKFIKKHRRKGISWEKIENLFDCKDIDEELKQLERYIYFPKMSKEEWFEIVRLEKANESDSEKLKNGAPMIANEGETNAIKDAPESPYSSWQKYKSKLAEKGFKEKNIEVIEDTALKTLKQLSENTQETGPIKGMVIGNVQSGKTANMEALMAMAADYDWNLFIVLSGMIENLRIQTQDRMFNDLKSEGPHNLNWRGLTDLSPNAIGENDIKQLELGEDSKERYFTVCLKNSKRLASLIQWIYHDPNKTKQMKIIVIDDEADQASVNTADITTDEKKKINELITNLVTGKTDKGKQGPAQFKAMNYIGYTATPYANILNEGPSEKSLYPKDFIATLNNSNEYFGPQVIFGNDVVGYEGMDIIRNISDDDIELVESIHDGIYVGLPESLKDAVCWFICCVASMRKKKSKKPMSMLIHTSRKIDHHDNMSIELNNWIRNEKNMMERCKSVWEYETKEFTLQKFAEQNPNYNNGDFEVVSDYLAFDEIKDEIKKLIEQKIQNIILSEEGQFEYSDGIHLCVDNSSNNKATEDGMYLRLVYPEKNKYDGYAPAFLVIGGNTLSRGLTIEGLTTTYFLRSVGQADTLMQMGRWFGYRKGYELLQRIWITDKARRQFEFLSELDYKLRSDIEQMAIQGFSPAKYGPRVQNTPQYKFIRITSKNKMQSANPTYFDYSGGMMETKMFSSDRADQLHNQQVLSELLNALPSPASHSNLISSARGSYVWRNIPYTVIEKFLKDYIYSERSKTFLNRDCLFEWLKKSTENGSLKNWNIILAGNKDTGEVISFDFGDLRKIQRNKLKSCIEDINIQILRTPENLILDLYAEDVENNPLITKKIKNFKIGEVHNIRKCGNIDDIPQLLIYVIDKNSKLSKQSNTRADLNAAEDLIGFSLLMPGIKKGVDYAEYISIDLMKPVFNDDGDIKG